MQRSSSSSSLRVVCGRWDLIRRDVAGDDVEGGGKAGQRVEHRSELFDAELAGQAAGQRGVAGVDPAEGVVPLVRRL
jgi:hypothetical protein